MCTDNIKALIDKVTNIDELRDIREYADIRVQRRKEQVAQANKGELEAKYRGKYLLIYGPTLMMAVNTPNQNDIKIVHVLDVNYAGTGSFKVNAKIIHIEYDSEYDLVSHLGANKFGSVKVTYSEDSQCFIRETDINEIIDKEKADGFIREAAEIQERLFKQWD